MGNYAKRITQNLVAVLFRPSKVLTASIFPLKSSCIGETFMCTSSFWLTIPPPRAPRGQDALRRWLQMGWVGIHWWGPLGWENVLGDGLRVGAAERWYPNHRESPLTNHDVFFRIYLCLQKIYLYSKNIHISVRCKANTDLKTGFYRDCSIQTPENNFP